MPIKERREYQLLNTAFKALRYNDWPSYLKPHIHDPTRTLRSSKETTLKASLASGTIQDSPSSVFNSFPSAARNSVAFSYFKTEVRKYLVNRVNARLISRFVYILDYFIYLFILNNPTGNDSTCISLTFAMLTILTLSCLFNDDCLVDFLCRKVFSRETMKEIRQRLKLKSSCLYLMKLMPLPILV